MPGSTSLKLRLGPRALSCTPAPTLSQYPGNWGVRWGVHGGTEDGDTPGTQQCHEPGMSTYHPVQWALRLLQSAPLPSLPLFPWMAVPVGGPIPAPSAWRRQVGSWPFWGQASTCSPWAGFNSLHPLILHLSSILMAEHRTPVSPPLSKPFSTWAHFLSIPHFSISASHQASYLLFPWMGSLLTPTHPSASVCQTPGERDLVPAHGGKGERWWGKRPPNAPLSPWIIAE